MAKTEGGIGLDEGMVQLDQVAQLISFITNENKGRVGTSVPQNNFMNFLLKKLRQEQEGAAKHSKNANKEDLGSPKLGDNTKDQLVSS